MLMQTLRSGQPSSVIGLVCVKLFMMKDIQVHVYLRHNDSLLTTVPPIREIGKLLSTVMYQKYRSMTNILNQVQV